jgi:hypothetical protein
MSQITINDLSPDLLQQLKTLFESQAKGTAGNRSPIPVQLKDLRDPGTQSGRLHRPSFVFSAEADTDARPYVHQAFPKILYHAKTGAETLALSQENMDALGAEWQEFPPHAAKMTAFDAAKSELDSLSEEDRKLVAELTRKAKIDRVNALMASLSESEIAALTNGSEPAKRGPGRPPKVQ